MPPAFRRPGLRLVLTSGTLLFVELVLLRWIPANVTYIGFFSNFLLMASFLGIGAGILLGRRSRDLAWSPFPGLFLLVVALIQLSKLDVQLRAGRLQVGADAGQHVRLVVADPGRDAQRVEGE